MDPVEDNEPVKNNNSTTTKTTPAVIDLHKPWPNSGAHDTFLRSVATQQHLVLEIASGASAKHAPALLRQSDSTDDTGSDGEDDATTAVLLPGSLRERGEFCLVDFGLTDLTAAAVAAASATTKNNSSSTAAAAALKPKFAWRVKNVDFHQLDRYRTQR